MNRTCEDEPHDEGPDDIDAPEIPEDDMPNADIPTAVTEALAQLYQRLSADQAAALAELFTAVSNASAEGSEDEMPDDGDDESVEDEEAEAPLR